jgi:hypothetical protein
VDFVKLKGRRGSVTHQIRGKKRGVVDELQQCANTAEEVQSPFRSQKLNDGRSLKKCSLFFLHGQKVAGEGFRRRRWMRNDRDSGQRRKQLGAKRREE